MPPTADHKARLALAAVALSALAWGCWWIPLRALSNLGLTTDWTSLVLYGIAAAVLVPAAWRQRRWMRAGGVMLLGAGVLTGTMLATWNHALIVGDVVRVTLLFYLAPIWGTLLALVALDHKLGPLRGFTVLLGLGGAAVVLGFEGGVPLPRGRGEWLGLLSGVLFALGATCAHKIPEVPALAKTFVTFVAATVASAAMLLLLPGGAPLPMGVAPVAWPLAAAVSVLIMVPITGLLLWGAGRLDPGRVSILYIFEVVAASVSATLLTAETFTLRDGLGAALIVGAVLLEGFDQLRERRSQWAEMV